MRHFLACGAAALIGCNTVLGIDDGTPRQGAECSTHKECLDLTGEAIPSACVSGHCVELRSQDCPLLLPQTERLWLDNLRGEPEALIVGAYAYIGQDPYGVIE